MQLTTEIHRDKFNYPFHHDICFRAIAPIHVEAGVCSADMCVCVSDQFFLLPVGGMQGHALKVFLLVDLCLQALQILR